jgi:hypothetical protein
MSVAQDVAAITEREHSFNGRGVGPSEWTLWQKIAFRFSFCYLVPYGIVAIENLESPQFSRLMKPYDWIAQAVVPWVGKHILNMTRDIPKTMTGGPDDAASAVSILCFVVLGIAVTLVWSLLDRKRKEYDRLYDWLRTYVRYVLALNMFVYGMAKVIQLQFPFPGLGQLTTQFGQLPPAALLWNFMGYSRAYSFFAGLAEVAGAFLLFFRRTTTLGALVSAGVLLNVVMLNFCYDVIVKFIALHLLLMCVFLMIPDIKRLTNVLLLNRPALPVNIKTAFSGKQARMVGWVAKTLVIVISLFMLTKQTLDGQEQYITPKSALYGIYNVEEFKQNGKDLPLLTTDATEWRKVIFDSPSFMQVQLMDDSVRYYAATIDTAKNNLLLSTRGDDKKSLLTYSQPDADHLVLEGTIDNDSVAIRLRKYDKSKFPLVSRKLRWLH